jgi:hypothetical protein
MRNHASAVLACDFFVAITATFRVLHVFVVLDVGSRRILHWNVTEHPTADWTAQQFRMVVSGDEPYRFVIHDRDGIFSDRVDRTITAMGLPVLKTPAQSPQANAFCERLIGTIRRECLDWLIPLNDGHLRRLLRQWVVHCRHHPKPRQAQNPRTIPSRSHASSLVVCTSREDDTGWSGAKWDRSVVQAAEQTAHPSAVHARGRVLPHIAVRSFTGLMAALRRSRGQRTFVSSCRRMIECGRGW